MKIRFFTHYWFNETWEQSKASSEQNHHQLLHHSAGNLFTKRGVRIGDVIYVITVLKGSLFVCGKMVVGQICDPQTAATILPYAPWEAEEHIIASACTSKNFELKVPDELTKQLRFISGKKTLPLKFNNTTRLDQQTLRGVRQLDSASALLLDKLLPQLTEVFSESLLPEEIHTTQEYFEGALKQIMVNAYERNPLARMACIEHYGWDCFVCGLNFKNVYGQLGEGFIHVHHLTPLSKIGKEYKLDPIEHLRPVCPNCHAMIHRSKPELTIEELKELLRRNSQQH